VKKRKSTLLVVAILAGIAAVIYFVATRPPREIVLTGMVTTDEVNVSAEISGRLQQVLVREGDAVTNGQLLAVLQPQTQQADVSYYANTELVSTAQVAQAEADLKFQQAQTEHQTAQAEADYAAAQAQVAQGKAQLENAKLTYDRETALNRSGTESQQAFDQARTTYDAAKATVDALEKQAVAAQAAVALAKANADQVAAREAALTASRHQVAAVTAQKDKAQTQLGYTEVRAPLNGFVDVRAALTGEVITPGQAIVTLIDPDNLWVRADVEETYIDRVHLGDKLRVRLPSGAVREGTVFYRSADADYATQRDVSRTKRDIRTFAIRIRCDNQDRALAVGLTAYVLLPLAPPH
jgi:multidrug resistance efflux pump